MSELQNRAVEYMRRSIGVGEGSDGHVHGDAFFEHAIRLYFSVGGTRETALRLVASLPLEGRNRVDVEIGEVMVQLAAVSHFNDLDMIQAAYNKLDQSDPPLFSKIDKG